MGFQLSLSYVNMCKQTLLFVLTLFFQISFGCRLLVFCLHILNSRKAKCLLLGFRFHLSMQTGPNAIADWRIAQHLPTDSVLTLQHARRTYTPTCFTNHATDRKTGTYWPSLVLWARRLFLLFWKRWPKSCDLDPISTSPLFDCSERLPMR